MDEHVLLKGLRRRTVASHTQDTSCETCPAGPSFIRDTDPMAHCCVSQSGYMLRDMSGRSPLDRRQSLLAIFVFGWSFSGIEVSLCPRVVYLKSAILRVW